MPNNTHLMKVVPTHAAVGSFFKNDPMFRIPKYQRGYAWEKSEVDDFIDDMTKCFDQRKANSPINHFFGGIVSVEHDVSGVVSQKSFELVDGQQRLATFVLLIASIIVLYKELEKEASDTNDIHNKNIIEKRILSLSQRFIEFEQENNRVSSMVEVLRLSNADQPFFKELITQLNPTPLRASHRRILAAYNTLFAAARIMMATLSLTDKLDNLEIIIQLIDADFSLLHIVTHKDSEAYTLFRVLNDRGKSLTEGDLLRARVLEMLERYPSQQGAVESLWDDILVDEPDITEKFLKWVYISYTGRRADTNNFVDDFASQFYSMPIPSTVANANAIVQVTQDLQSSILNCRLLNDGVWPFVRRRPIEAWDVLRLNHLVKVLNVTVTIPILLAAISLGDRKFSAIVQTLERFMFRFKTVGNREITPLNPILYANSIAIRANPINYAVSSLATQLLPLVATVPDTTFKELLGNMEYKKGGNNQLIKYLLLTLESYWKWYLAGATGVPECQEKTRNYDFIGSTIEHIYPRSAPAASQDYALEPLKNTLGNLTVMDPADNQAGDNDDFATKRPIFLTSSVTMNKEIGANTQWTNIEVNIRAEQLKDAACKIFTVW